jgi:hypothetical protein
MITQLFSTRRILRSMPVPSWAAFRRPTRHAKDLAGVLHFGVNNQKCFSCPVLPTETHSPLNDAGSASLLKIRPKVEAAKCSQIGGHCRIERMEMIGMRLPITARKSIPPSTPSIVCSFPTSAAGFHATTISYHQNHSLTLLLARNAECALVNRSG